MTQKQLSKVLDDKLEENDKTALSERTFMYDGVLYPAMVCSQETLKRVNTFKARKDDIVLVAYPKTGSNWVEEILTHLEIASGKYGEDEQKQRQQILHELSLFTLLEFGDPEKFEMLVLFRNPKDVAVSLFHFSKSINRNSDQETWDEFFEEYITGKVFYGSYFDHITKWSNYLDDSNVFFITYEEIKENPAPALKKIAKFFDFSVTEEEIESIVKKTSFESMKGTAANYGKLGKTLFRKGIVGDWTSLFSESQSEKMDRKFEETVAKTKIGMKLKYELYCKH